MITNIFYRVRVKNDFVFKTLDGRKKKYLKGQWLGGICREMNAGFMFLSDGILFRMNRFDKLKDCETNAEIDLESDTVITFRHLIEMMNSGEKSEHFSNDLLL
ncbi:MAG: hypothetical protein D3924_04925 [Candidatus Electrothrix sp. AR4]|nr:hypothetical protein [Candidatus Electrothrix sp. AR4]